MYERDFRPSRHSRPVRGGIYAGDKRGTAWGGSEFDEAQQTTGRPSFLRLGPGLSSAGKPGQSDALESYYTGDATVVSPNDLLGNADYLVQQTEVAGRL